MSNYSDHKKPQFDVNQYLPEVYRSDVNTGVFDMAFNRHLTKDDTQRVAGIIGKSSPNALVKRQIQEPTPHRQAYQLAPTMYSQVGTVETALSFKAFLAQLELIGVNIDRLAEWADALQFNWVPPINIDMFVNYQDYFWNARTPDELPQYFTIENRCNKAKTKLSSYDNIISLRGETFDVAKIDFEQNAFLIDIKADDLFVDGFVFFTTNTTNVNLNEKFWTVQTSTYDQILNKTTIVVIEPIATHSNVQPDTTVVGQWWYDTVTSTLHQWNGSSWPLSTRAVSVTISLSELRAVYQTETNCACAQDFGWDISLWDDNQVGATLWNADLFSTPENPDPAHRIDFATAQDWLDWHTNHSSTSGMMSVRPMLSITPSTIPAANDLWYDTSSDELKQYTTEWTTVVRNFSALKAKTTGNSRWDLTVGCSAQVLNQWSDQNRWLHKTQVRSFSGVRRAQMPIIEYCSTAELNEWVEVSRTWKYRSQSDHSFNVVDSAPTRLELEPVKGFVVTNVGGVWYLFLANKNMSGTRDINYTTVFVPGFQFRVVDDGVMSDVYTVHSSEFRQITQDDVASVLAVNDLGYLCTVVRLEDQVYTSSIQGGGTNHVRIEPLVTSAGAAWRGYHVHWMLDETARSSKPTSGKQWNLLRKQDITDDPQVDLVKGNVAYSSIGFQPSNTSTVEIGHSYQSMTLSIPNAMQIDLVPKFRYNGTSANLYALSDSNDIRVYLNGIRQYGNYTVRTESHTPDYTLVGHFPHTATTIETVTGIMFDRPLKANDTVRIEVGPASFFDMGNYSVPVRTQEDETQFTLDVANGAQPVYRSLSKFVLFEQQKTKVNEYPLFNVYDVVTGDVAKASSLFSYTEDSSAAINSVLQRRIVTSGDGRDFQFTQDLVDRDDNILYGYRDAAIAQTFWFNTSTNTLLFWDQQGWTQTIPVTVNGGLRYYTAQISDSEPESLLTTTGALWFDTQTNTLKQRDTTNNVWNLVSVVVGSSDPSLRTVWRKGSNNERTIPKYVDKDRNEVDLGSSDGDWGIVDQWTYNTEHKNKKLINYSQLITHFTSIITNQPKVPGLQGGGSYTLQQSSYNYGVGGTIKEHNDSFDTLISAINVTNTTPVGIMEYAARQYTSSTMRIRELFTKHAVSLITDYSPTAMLDLSSFVTSQVIIQYQNNDSFAQIFGDTSAYDNDTHIGVKNWIATSPMFGLAQRHVPIVNKLGQLYEVTHHDGHRTTVTFSALEIDRLARLACSKLDPRAQTAIGRISSTTPPANATDVEAAFGSVRRGLLWYRSGNGIRALYRLELVDVSPVDPALVINGIAVPEGAMYFNSHDRTLYTMTGGSWVIGAAPGVLSSAWAPVDFSAMLANVHLEIENRLYDVTPTQDLVFDYSTLTPTIAERAEYDRLYASRFLTYVRVNEIDAPLVNIGYQASNAFTWNYASSMIVSPPRLDITPAPAGSWQELYLRWYGTPYPHLEPWKLQGYDNKPMWWDATYKDTTGARRWNYTHSTTVGAAVGMWENIRTGRVPAGKVLPTGLISTGAPGQVPSYTYFSVNISNQTLGAVAPDELLPPYFQLTSDPMVRSLFGVYTTEINSPDADYVFGDVGPVEWQWKTSVEYRYDIAIVAFLMQPARFLHAAFGPKFTNVDGLQVETKFKQVYSHEDALFHGDIFNTNNVYTCRGINQWYVNYNRDVGFDTSGEFRTQWCSWVPKLTYQFGGIVDTSSFEISNKYMDVIEQDFNILLVNNGVFKDLWSDAFDVKLISSPPPLVQYNNQSNWKMELDTLSAIPRPINYYGVKQYTQQADPILRGQLDIVDVVDVLNELVVAGKLAATFPPGTQLNLTDSSVVVNGTYTVASASNVGNQTVIRLVEPIVRI